jgi:hypothetical protein
MLYNPIVPKTAENHPSFMVAIISFDLLCDVNLLIFFSSLLPMLQTIYALMKSAQKQDIFVCDYVITIKICHGQFYFPYSNRATNYVFDVSKEY